MLEHTSGFFVLPPQPRSSDSPRRDRSAPGACSAPQRRSARHIVSSPRQSGWRRRAGETAERISRPLAQRRSKGSGQRALLPNAHAHSHGGVRHQVGERLHDVYVQCRRCNQLELRTATQESDQGESGLGGRATIHGARGDPAVADLTQRTLLSQARSRHSTRWPKSLSGSSWPRQSTWLVSPLGAVARTLCIESPACAATTTSLVGNGPA
jgi:hypothetical protein